MLMAGATAAKLRVDWPMIPFLSDRCRSAAVDRESRAERRPRSCSIAQRHDSLAGIDAATNPPEPDRNTACRRSAPGFRCARGRRSPAWWCPAATPYLPPSSMRSAAAVSVSARDAGARRGLFARPAVAKHTAIVERIMAASRRGRLPPRFGRTSELSSATNDSLHGLFHILPSPARLRC